MQTMYNYGEHITLSFSRIQFGCTFCQRDRIDIKTVPVESIMYDTQIGLCTVQYSTQPILWIISKLSAFEREVNKELHLSYAPSRPTTILLWVPVQIFMPAMFRLSKAEQCHQPEHQLLPFFRRTCDEILACTIHQLPLTGWIYQRIESIDCEVSHETVVLKLLIIIFAMLTFSLWEMCL